MNNLRKYVLAVLAVFGFIVVFEWMFHGIFLNDLYMQTQNLWRAKEETKMPLMVFGQMLFSLIFVLIYTYGHQNRGTMEGVRYGALIGLLAVSHHLVMYSVQPLPENLVVLWTIGGMVEMILAGAILATVWKK